MSRLLDAGGLQGLDFETLEHQCREVALKTAAAFVEARLNADHSDHAGATRACTCGGTAHYRGRREKRFTSILGRLRLGRAYYHCPSCGHGTHPRDRALGMEGTSLSPGATRMVGFAAGEISFGRSSELLRVLAGLRLGAKQVERTAEALGAEIARDEQERVEAAAPAADTLYLGMDGTGMPVRPSETAGRPGKQPDGSAKTREVKAVQVWFVRVTEDGLLQRVPGSVTYSAAVESAAVHDTDRQLPPFAQRVGREAARRGFDQAERQVILGDGAAWIWNLAAEQFPRAVQIVDLFHAKQRLWKVAHEVYGTTSEVGAAWAHAGCAELEAGRLPGVRAALRAHAATHEEAQAALVYFRNNADRMRYAEFRRQGLGVSSGVVEAGCKRVVGARLKGSGMRWTVAGGNTILALRSCILSGRFEDFWVHRTRPAPDLIKVSLSDENAELTGLQPKARPRKAA